MKKKAIIIDVFTVYMYNIKKIILVSLQSHLYPTNGRVDYYQEMVMSNDYKENNNLCNKQKKKTNILIYCALQIWGLLDVIYQM